MIKTSSWFKLACLSSLNAYLLGKLLGAIAISGLLNWQDFHRNLNQSSYSNLLYETLLKIGTASTALRTATSLLLREDFDIWTWHHRIDDVLTCTHMLLFEKKMEYSRGWNCRPRGWSLEIQKIIPRPGNLMIFTLLDFKIGTVNSFLPSILSLLEWEHL